MSTYAPGAAHCAGQGQAQEQAFIDISGCEVRHPEAPVVNTSAVWMLALTCAGGRPMLSITDEDTRPNAMPSAPSTSCAPRPMRMNHQNSLLSSMHRA